MVGVAPSLALFAASRAAGALVPPPLIRYFLLFDLTHALSLVPLVSVSYSEPHSSGLVCDKYPA